eukprot:Sdes_comp15582_c0_seq2m4566
MFDLETGEWKKTFLGHTHIVNSVAITSSRKHLVSGSMDNTIKVHRLRDAECIYTLYGTTSQKCLVVENNVIIAASSNFTIRIWDLVSGASNSVLSGHSNSIVCIKSCQPSSPYLISSALDESIRVWDIPKAKSLHVLHQEGGCFNIVILLHPIILCGGTGCIKAWDIESGECTRTIPLGAMGSVMNVNHLLWTGSKIICDSLETIKVISTPSASPDSSEAQNWGEKSD